jgi:hypothetical protein
MKLFTALLLKRRYSAGFFTSLMEKKGVTGPFPLETSKFITSLMSTAKGSISTHARRCDAAD